MPWDHLQKEEYHVSSLQTDEDDIPIRTGLVCSFVFFADWSEQRV